MIPSISDDDLASSEWSIELEPQVRDRLLCFLRRLRTAVGKWEKLPPSPRARPDEHVILRGYTNDGSPTRMALSLSGVLFDVYGYEDGVTENEFTVVREESESAAGITSLIDRDSILERLDLWIGKTAAGTRRSEDRLAEHSGRLRSLVAAAAYRSTIEWDRMIVFPNAAPAGPEIWDEVAQAGHVPDPIEYVPNDALRQALVAARDPFIHVRLEAVNPVNLRVCIGGADHITVAQDLHPLEILRLLRETPEDHRLTRIDHPFPD